MRVCALLLVLLAGCKRTPPAATAPRAEPGSTLLLLESDAAEAREAAHEAASAGVLGLAPALIQQIDGYAERAEVARSAETVCAALPEAAELAKSLQTALTSRFEKLAGTADDDTFWTAMADLDEALPGVALLQTAVGPLAHLDLSAVAERIGKATPSGQLLLAAGALLDATDTLVSSDDQKCLDFDRGVPAVRALAEAWPAAPVCLRKALHEPIARSLGDSVSGAFCSGEQSELVQGAARYAQALEQLAELDGKRLGRAVREAATARNAARDPAE